MKEYIASNGGRYTFIDDITNLQEMALAFSEIFADCGNFVVSGCGVSGSRIAPGCVFINGKLRKFDGADGVSLPVYIYEQNTSESVTYANQSGDKVGRIVYHCLCGASVPETVDEITGKVPQFIALTERYTPGLRDAFFGKYALMVDSPFESQTVNKRVLFNHAVRVVDSLFSQSSLGVESDGLTFKTFIEGGAVVTVLRRSEKQLFKISIAEDSLRIEDGTGIIATLGKTRFEVADSFMAPKLRSRSMLIEDNLISNTSSNSDTGSVDINWTGYNSGVSKFRDFKVFDGKKCATALLKVSGANKLVSVTGRIELVSTGVGGFDLKHSSGHVNLVNWYDSKNVLLGSMGYNSAENKNFTIANKSGSIFFEVGPGGFADIPKIKESGKFLEEKYLQKSDATQIYATKDYLTSNYYTDTAADRKYISISKNFEDMVDWLKTQDSGEKNPDGTPMKYTDESARKHLRKSLDALGNNEATGLYANKSKKLADLIVLSAAESQRPQGEQDKIKAAQQKQICDNIGAAFAAEYQPRVYDSGWKTIFDGAIGFRQIGMVVYIEGYINPSRFNYTKIPEGIGKPRFGVSQHFGQFGGYDYARGAKVIVESDYIHCEHCSDDAWVRLCITYIVN